MQFWLRRAAPASQPALEREQYDADGLLFCT
jgi:hypothetical protein